jgi:hypothetical protein
VPERSQRGDDIGFRPADMEVERVRLGQLDPPPRREPGEHFPEADNPRWSIPGRSGCHPILLSRFAMPH